MGDIADMHIEAFAAGLDPNEMDGADWADFLSDDELIFETPEEAASAFVRELNGWILRGIIGDQSLKDEQLADTMKRLFPYLTEGQISGFLAVADALQSYETFELTDG